MPAKMSRNKQLPHATTQIKYINKRLTWRQ